MSKNHVKLATCLVVALMLVFGATAGWAQTAQNVVIEDFNPATSSPYLDALWSFTGAAGTAEMATTGFRWAARRYVGSVASNPDYASRVIRCYSSSQNMRSLYGFAGGSYYFTIFNSNSPDVGSFDSDQYVDLSTPGAKIVADFNEVVILSSNAESVVRHMIRVRDGGDRIWYVSEPISIDNNVDAAVVLTTVVADVQWQPVNENVLLNNMITNFDSPPNQYSDTPSDGSWPTQKNVLTFGAAVTPNFAQVDGGGIYSESGHDGSTGAISAGPQHTSCTEIKWTSNLQEVGFTPSFGHPLSGAQGFKTDPDTQTVTVNNVGGGALSITGWELIDEEGVFSFTSPGAVSVPGGGSTTVNVTYDPAVGQTPPHLGYLVVTSNAFGVSGTTTSLMLVAQPLRQVAQVLDWIPVNANVTVCTTVAETPQPTLPWEMGPVGNREGYQGFRWGGFHGGTGQSFVIWTGTTVGRIIMFGVAGTGSSANTVGSYAYTIFDNFGGNVATKYVNLEKIRLHTDQTWSGQVVRWLVRDATNNWFLSVGTTSVPVPGDGNEVTVDVDDVGGWLAVDAAANADMNELDSDAEVPMGAPGSLSAGSPDFTQVTGGGVYVEVGDIDAARYNFIPDVFTWIKRPDPNETIGMVAADAATSNLLVCANRPIGLVALDPVFDAGEWEIALDSISCTLTGNGSGAVEIREVLVYSDPNGDGALGDGALLARGPVSGSTGVATFIDGPLLITRDTPYNLIYAVLFDEEAVGTTWDISIAVGDFAISADGGAGDSVALSGIAAAQAIVGSIAIPTGDASFSRTVLAETWDGVTTAILPTDDLYTALGVFAGNVPGPDNTWSFNLTNTGGYWAKGMGFRTPSGGTVAGGRETDHYSEEAIFYATSAFGTGLLSPITVTDSTVVSLDFTVYVTQSYGSTDVPFDTGYSGLHQVGFYSDFWVSLGGEHADQGDGYITLDFFPTTDNDTYAYQLDVDGNEDEQGNLNLWASQATLAGYGSAGGISTYEVSIQVAPYDEMHSIVSLDITNTATSQGDSFVSVIDGRLALIDFVNLSFGSMANSLLDDIVLTDTTVKDQVTNVGTWSLYE
ncbi:hypothetical protein HQ520_18110 [bacterium]|nr:hypothetical protein [bacterium]